MTDYDEYHVPPVEPPRFTYTPPHLSASEIADSYAAHEFFSRRRFFSYRYHLNDSDKLKGWVVGN